MLAQPTYVPCNTAAIQQPDRKIDVAFEDDDEVFQLVIEARELAKGYGLEGSSKAIQTALSTISLETRERSKAGLSSDDSPTRPAGPTTIFALKFHSNEQYRAIERRN